MTGRTGLLRSLCRLTALGAACVLAVSVPCRAGSAARVFVETPDRLLKGEARGLAVTTRGRLFPAPALEVLSALEGRLRESHVWSLAASASGTVYVGTGPEGRILRVDPAGRARIFQQVDEPLVTALQILPGGDILAGTAPEGRIYRFDAEGQGGVWAETGERYVWALLARPDGSILAATGESGRLLRVRGRGDVEILLDTDEPHLVCLDAWERGWVLAGSSGGGVLYAVGPEGEVRVLYDDDALPEIRDAVAAHDGVYALALGPPLPESPRPRLRLQLPEGTPLGGPAEESVGRLEERPGPLVEGTLEGLRLPEPPGPRLRGRLVWIPPGRPPQEIWRSAREAPFAAAVDPAGRVVFGAGEPAQLYRVESPEEVSRLARLPQAQMTALLSMGTTVIAATSNPAAVYRLQARTAEQGTIVSLPVDAGTRASWGSAILEGADPPGAPRLLVRSGDRAEPDVSWSAWQEAVPSEDGRWRVVTPAARFFQYRLELGGRGERSAEVRGIRLAFAPANRPPAIVEVTWRPGPSDPPRPGVEVEARIVDPDADTLQVSLEARQPPRGAWSPVRVSQASLSPGGCPGVEGPCAVVSLAWDAAGADEAEYEVRLHVSDAPDNDPRMAAGASTLPRSLRVDRTPPEVRIASRSGEAVTLEVRDAFSPLAAVRVVRDGTPLASPIPEDGVLDSAEERFVLETSGLLGPPFVFEATDASGNTARKEIGP